MARHLRHHVPGGWYHITSRGLGCRDIFKNDRGIVLSIAHAHCGLTLRELGVKTEMSSDAVSKAVSRINNRMTVDSELKDLYDLSVSKLGELGERQKCPMS